MAEYRKTLLHVLPDLRAALRCDTSSDDRCAAVDASIAALQAAERVDTRSYVASDPDVPGRVHRVRGDDPSAPKPGEETWD